MNSRIRIFCGIVMYLKFFKNIYCTYSVSQENPDSHIQYYESPDTLYFFYRSYTDAKVTLKPSYGWQLWFCRGRAQTTQTTEGEGVAQMSTLLFHFHLVKSSTLGSKIPQILSTQFVHALQVIFVSKQCNSKALTFCDKNAFLYFF